MGRTLPAIAQVFLHEEESFSRFRRALRRTDQLLLDDLFASAQKHLAAAAYAAHALPFETFLLAMLLEQHRETVRHRAVIEANQQEIARLSDRLKELLDDEPPE